MPEGKKTSLEDVSRKPPFAAPDGYFESLPGVISRRVQEAAPAARYRTGQLGWSFGLAALALLCVLGYWIYSYTAAPSEPLQPLTTVSNQELVEYLATHADISAEEWMETAGEAGVRLDEVPWQVPVTDPALLLEELDPEALEELL